MNRDSTDFHSTRKSLFGVQLGAFDGVMNQKKGVNTISFIKKGNKSLSPALNLRE